VTRRQGNRHLTFGLAAVGLLVLVIAGALAAGGSSAVALVPGIGILASAAGMAAGMAAGTVAGSGARGRSAGARRGVAVVVIVVALVVGVLGVNTLIWRVGVTDLLLGLALVGAAGAMVALGVEIRDAARR
jgi:hypothetical protein